MMDVLFLLSTWLLFLVAGCILFLIIISTFVQSFWMVPFIPTPRAIIDGMIEYAELKPNERVYDLGAGDGRVLLAAEKAEPTIRATGYEGAFGVWLLSMLRMHLRRSNVTMKCQDFMKIDLSDADVIFTYLSIDSMKKLKPKFDAELKDGARVISHAFRVPAMTPDRERMVTMPMGRGSHIYRYRWRKSTTPHP